MSSHFNFPQRGDRVFLESAQGVISCVIVEKAVPGVGVITKDLDNGRRRFVGMKDYPPQGAALGLKYQAQEVARKVTKIYDGEYPDVVEMAMDMLKLWKSKRR